MTTDDARISPVFRYKDAARAIGWLEQAFGFTTAERHAAPDGSIVHAELRYGTGAIGVSSAAATVDDNPWSQVRSGLYVCLADVDGMHQRAVGAGASIATPLTDTSYGAREFSVRDPGGHLWSFGTYGMGAAEGRPTICAAFRYRDAVAAMDWLSRAFALVAEHDHRDGAGRVVHAELSLGRDTVMLSDELPADTLWGDNELCTCVHAEDPDRHYANAERAGAEILRAPFDTPYGSRDYYARDPEGFLWGFSTYRPAPATARLG